MFVKAQAGESLANTGFVSITATVLKFVLEAVHSAQGQLGLSEIAH